MTITKRAGLGRPLTHRELDGNFDDLAARIAAIATPDLSPYALKSALPINVFSFMTAAQIADVQSGAATMDVSAAIISALDYANGRRVYAPAGVYRITRPITNTIAGHIRLVGAGWSFLSHDGAAGVIANTNSSAYTDLPAAAMATTHTVFLCDGCNLVGAPDGASMNASDKLRELRDCIAWGKSGAKIGVYARGSDTVIDGVTFVLFEMFGVLSRAQIVSKLGAIATIDCGWNLAASGTIGYPNTYYSGCGILIAANVSPNDYTTVSPASRPTSLELSGPFFFWMRNHTAQNKSGLRGMHAHGLVSANVNSLAGYTGCFFNICTGMQLDGYYIENFSVAGVSAGDAAPRAMYFVNCLAQLGQGYLVNSGSQAQTIAELNTGTNGINHRVVRPDNYGTVRTPGPFKPNNTLTVAVGTPGSTVNYTFANMLSNTQAVAGILAVSVIGVDNFINYVRAFFLVANHRAGASGWQPMVSNQLYAQAPANITGNYAATIGAPTWNGGDLIIPITWGSGWSASTQFQIDLAIVGCEPKSA